MTADSRARWSERLRTPADASAEVALAAFLRALPGDDFAPPAERVAALNALASTAAPVGPDDAVEHALRDEVESFARQFWTIPPVERQAAWTELLRHGAPVARLRELEPGLSVTTPVFADPVAEELAGLFRALFVLPPRERSIRRNTWLLDRATDTDRWSSALAVLQQEAPALCALEPHLVTALSTGFARDVFAAAAHEDAHERQQSSVAKDVAIFTARMRDYEQGRAARPEPRAPKPSAAPRATGQRANPAIGVGILIALFLLIRVVALLDRSDTNPAPTYNPQPYAPYAPQPAVPKYEVPAFTPEDVARFQRHERDIAAGRFSPEPTGYTAWVLAGSPEGTSGIGNVPVPKPGERLVYLDPDQLRRFRAYEQSPSGKPPMYFAEWVTAGRPSVAGFIRVPTNP